MTNEEISTQETVSFYRNWRDLITPDPLTIDQDSRTENYGKFVCQPLERGFATTIGNSLRRILLSSVQGAAITSVKIDGALHEFSTLPGILEDVTEIIGQRSRGPVPYNVNKFRPMDSFCDLCEILFRDRIHKVLQVVDRILAVPIESTQLV